MTEEKKINNLYEYIDLIRERTAVYVGENTLSALYFHINGYNMACSLKGIDENLQPEFHLFHDFVADYYLHSESTAGWKNIILAENFGIEKQALDDFWKLFDLFRQNPIIANPKKILFKILDKLLLKQINLTNFTQDNFKSIYNKLIDLPNRLEQVKFSFEYDNILEDLEEFGKTNEYFRQLLADLKKDQT